MSTIIAGHFATKVQADSAVRTLLSGGIGLDHIIKAGHMDGLFRLKAASEGGASSPEDTTVVGTAGFLVAVSTPMDAERVFAAGVLRVHGAKAVEEIERVRHEGKWSDLDLASAAAKSP
jgi:hypothetical protein